LVLVFRFFNNSKFYYLINMNYSEDDSDNIP
jgi:hypothetical protein